MSEEIEARKTAGGNHIIGLILCFIGCLTLMAMPLYCVLNSENKTIKKTNEQIILNWLYKTKKGKNIQGVDPKTTVTTTVGTIIREDQIKAAEKTDEGWLVTTNENRLLLVPRN